MDLSEARRVNPSEGEWYDEARYALVKRLLAPVLHQAHVTVDLGCGTGGIAARLNKDFGTTVHAHDPFLGDDDVRRLSDLGVVATAEFPAHLEGQAHVVLLMDVLEHVDAPAELLDQALALLAPSGHLLATVPAYRWLWSSHDVALGHRDRYTRRRLTQLIETKLPQHWTVSSGYAFPALLVGAAPVRLAERLRNARRPATTPDESQLQRISPGVAQVLQRVGTLEARAFGRRSPFGLTCAAVVKAPQKQS